MMIPHRGRSQCFGACLAVLAVGLATPGYAQVTDQRPVAAEDDASSGDIIVTAQRRAERLQDVPIAISAISSEDLSNRNVVDLTSLRGSVPGLTVSTSGGVNASNLVSIRGITGQPLPIGAGQATAIYLDGVYLSRPDAAFFTLDDVERIEVLRGPQGTLYGRNATAGAINIVTRTPGDTPEGGFDLALGSYGSVSAKGSVGLPIAAGLSFGVSASYRTHHGYYTNLVTGGNVGDEENFTLRGKLHYASPDDAFRATLSGDLSNINGFDVFRNAVPGGVYVGVGNPDVISIDTATVNIAGVRTRARGVSLVMDYEASPNLTLTSISSYRKIRAFSSFDLDGSAAPALISAANNYSRAISQELRLHLEAGAFDLTVGGNYYDERATWGGYAGPPPALAIVTNNPFDTTKLQAAALFAQLEFKLTEQLTLVGGLRYNHEERDFTNDYRGVIPASTLKSGTIRDKVLIPSFGVNFKATPDILLYAKASQGYQAPGFNPSPGAFATADTFAAEKLWAYEAGVKSQLFDRRVTLNVTGYYYDYSDIQVRSVPAIGLNTIDNAASAKVKGVEASLEVRPVQGLTLSAQATYSDAKYGDFCQPISAGDPIASDPLCAPGFADRKGNRLSQAPQWSGGLNLNYVTAVGSAGDIKLNVGYSWESIGYFTAANERSISTNGWDRVDARLGFEITDGPELYIFGRNLTDRRYVGYSIRGNAALAPASLNEPRIYGAGVRMRF